MNGIDEMKLIIWRGVGDTSTITLGPVHQQSKISYGQLRALHTEMEI